MSLSNHYQELVGVDDLSKNKLRLIHNLVNTAKSFLKNGKTSYGRTFHCCFAIEHGKVVEVGFNSYKHTIDYIPGLGKIKHYSDSTYVMVKHAEIDLILKFGNIDYSKICFLNVHIDKNGKCRMSQPCLNCLRMMKIVGVKSCWYFNEPTNQWLSLKF